ncbi:hypothetical protein [Kitasatospora sp. NBC_01302]|uniref:hypothetical protein n=1 Tax=Kitasatospora sp. NBC_01302 TaxID=2903575 RepID=UPI002E0E33BE|nr:hypothetical protein OG294_14215 [Kitasatospora sp. NBC_01302]
MTTAEDQSTTYHWIITGQSGDGRIATYNGRIEVHSSHTRMHVYTYLREHLQEQMGGRAVVVLYFDLAPMQFPTTGSGSQT